MLTDRDIRAAARHLIDRRGPFAPSHAALRAAALLKAGNIEGGNDWLRVKADVEILLRSERAVAE
jgi:hypothetical protein